MYSKRNQHILVEHLQQQQPLSVICYILWYIFQQPEKTDFAFSINPLSFIFRFENKYTLMGKDIWQLGGKVRWFRTNIVLRFEKQRWHEITQRFSNFRSLETNKPMNSYSTYLTLALNQEDFSFSEPVNENITEFSSPDYPLPKRYRHFDGGLAFGILKNDNIACFAAAPHILTQGSFSFCILRGIETLPSKRRQSYALNTVGTLCKEVYTRYKVSNIFLWVEETNTAAQNLYKKIGFHEEAKIYTTYCDQRM